MASGLFALLDDIATLMDDVAVMSKVAAKKTAGILGDDLAVNAEKASGFVSERELPVIWAITKGSALNKLIILPVAFLLSSFAPLAITVILVVGGLYLAFEGAEKIHAYIFPHPKENEEKLDLTLSKEEVLALEKKKIKSAITTDFILSVEIVIIAMSTVVDKPILNQVAVVSLIALIATVGVYGIVAIVVRMDDRLDVGKCFASFRSRNRICGYTGLIAGFRWYFCTQHSFFSSPFAHLARYS
jgi:predicted DNA repair protein MutK